MTSNQQLTTSHQPYTPPMPHRASRHLPERQAHPLFRKHLALCGIGIGMNEASRKYDVPQPTISRWAKAGWIRVMGKDPGYVQNRRLWIDEGEVAYCAEVYHLKQAGGRKQGRKLFAGDGTPFEPVLPAEKRTSHRPRAT